MLSAGIRNGEAVVSWVLHGQSKSVQDNLSMLVGMGAFVVFNYVGQRVVVFKEVKEGIVEL